jgi:hypothetical protein
MPETPLRMPVRLREDFDYKPFDTTGFQPATDAEVEGIEAVNKLTGFENDNFTNDEVLKVLLDSSHKGQCDLTMWVAPETKQRASPSWYEVQITFYEIEIETLELWDFNYQNVISNFLVKRQDDGKLHVLLSSKFGCGFKVICKRAKVVSVEPTDAKR